MQDANREAVAKMLFGDNSQECSEPLNDWQGFCAYAAKMASAVIKRVVATYLLSSFSGPLVLSCCLAGVGALFASWLVVLTCLAILK